MFWLLTESSTVTTRPGSAEKEHGVVLQAAANAAPARTISNVA